MNTIIIDEEFRALLPTLSEETFVLLEENILQNGCRDSLVLWGDILIDGHNRYEICTKHDIPFNTIQKEFDTREDALIWIISTQVSRRNLTPIQLSYFRGLHYMTDKKARGTINQYTPKSGIPQNEGYQKHTADRLSEQYKVSRATIERDSKVSEAIDAVGRFSPEAKRKILSGEVVLTKKALEGMASRPEEEVDELAMRIEEGTYGKKDPAADAAASSPIDVALLGMLPLGKVVERLAEILNSALPDIKKKAERARLQTALKPCIERLESLYSRI